MKKSLAGLILEIFGIIIVSLFALSSIIILKVNLSHFYQNTCNEINATYYKNATGNYCQFSDGSRAKVNIYLNYANKSKFSRGEK